MGKIVTFDSLRKPTGEELYGKLKSSLPINSPIKVLVGILTPGPMVYFETMRNYMNMVFHTMSERASDGSAKYLPLMGHERCTNIVAGRNDVCKKALELKADYVLMLDSDMAFPKEALLQLLALDKDIVSALAVLKTFPYKPVMGNRIESDNPNSRIEQISDWEANELLPVDTVGAAFLLFKTDVLEKIGYPYFHYEWINDGEGYDLGEDYYFCSKAKESGFDIFVDTSLQIGHIGTYTVTVDDYLASGVIPGKLEDRREQVES